MRQESADAEEAQECPADEPDGDLVSGEEVEQNRKANAATAP